TLIIHGPRIAAVAAERPEVDEAGLPSPRTPVTRACRRVALADRRVVAAQLLRPTAQTVHPDVDHSRIPGPHEGVVLPGGCQAVADDEAVVSHRMGPAARPAEGAEIEHAGHAGPHERMGDVTLR